MNQKCIGIVMTAPKEAVSIYALISNKKLTNDKIFHELNDKYELVSFWSVDAENEFKDIFVELRETQEINEGNLSNTFSITYYAQIKIEPTVYKKTVNNFKNYNKSSTIFSKDNALPQKEDEKIKVVQESPHEEIKTEYKGYHINKYNKILFVNINGSYYYVYSPLYLQSESNKGTTIHIGIVLELGSIVKKKKRRTNVIESILHTKKNNDKNKIYNALRKYLSMNGNDLLNSNHLFKFNRLLFKENKHLNETRINKEIISKEGFYCFANNVIDILDSLPDYANAQIRKRDNTMLFSENYNGITIPGFFKSESQSHNNCYIRYKTGEIGFKVKFNGQDIFLKFKIPSIDKNFKTVTVNNIITVNVLKWHSQEEIDQYGMNDERLSAEIITRIKILYSPISDTTYSLYKFFEKTDDLRQHPKIKSLYERIKESYPFTVESYDKYCKEMKYLRNYIENPHLITSNNTTTSISNSIISNYSIINYNYKDYKGTNGLFYSLSNEFDVLNSNISLKNIQAQFIKKFAYVPNTNDIKKLFSLLVVDVDLNNSKINIECYGSQKKDYSFIISVSAYSFSFITAPQGNALYYARIIAAVCNKAFQNYQHNSSNTYRISNKIVPNKTIVLDEVEVVNYNAPKTYSAQTGSDHFQFEASSTKDIHFRRGHWHYYWYGHRNSPDRHKKLKWINETIVNRNASTVIIQL